MVSSLTEVRVRGCVSGLRGLCPQEPGSVSKQGPCGGLGLSGLQTRQGALQKERWRPTALAALSEDGDAAGSCARTVPSSCLCGPDMQPLRDADTYNHNMSFKVNLGLFFFF